MWALVESGSVTTVYKSPKALTLGSVQYPRNIFELWTEAELQAINIYTCIEDKRNWKNQKYYNNTSATYAYKATVTINGVTHKKVVTESYGTATAKSLTDSTFSAQDETDGLGTEGEVKAKGLKTLHKEAVNAQAYSLLQDNDWMVVRKEEAGTAIPSDWSTFRANVRSTADSMKTKIDAVSDVDALAALYEYNDANPPVRPLGDFPKKPSS
tara:strand:- start:1469 stop:2104 length:636 start_codon:yes stop_codon:yes gene_type:complete